MRNILLAAAAVWTASGASASASLSESRNREARVVLNRFAACAAQHQPKLSRHFILHPDEQLAPPDFKKLVSVDCLFRTSSFVTSLRMRGLLFRGALAEELIRAEMPALLVVPASLPALDWPDPTRPALVDERGRAWTRGQREALELHYAAAVADNLVARLGECVVRADPGGSRAVVAAKMDSPEEIAAMRAMGPTIAACVATGQTLKFNRTTFRAGLAVSYYRLGAAAEPRAEA